MPRLQCNRRTTREHRHTRIAAGRELKNASEILRMEQKDWIGETKVINEALAEEVRRGEQRKKRSDGTTAAVPETGSTAPEPMAGSAAPELREDPIEPDPNPKRRLVMKSASSTASGSGQQRQKRAIPDGRIEECKSRTCSGDLALVKAQRCLQHRQRITRAKNCCEVGTNGSHHARKKQLTGTERRQ